jgi:uncharacterized protein YeaO (DUF488 family)
VKLRPVNLKRVCERPGENDGMRVLVDRLWPRGLSKQQVCADLWLREVAPSPELRRWYGHDPSRWSEFGRKYRTELSRQPELINLLQDLRRRMPLTLIYAGRDETRSHAAVLKALLQA